MVNAKIETIGPEEAKRLLELNTQNFRKMDMKRVELYAKEMSAGNWELNGETIKINGGVLLDGQTRLMAVVKSGVPIQVIVVRGVVSDGKTLDRGKPRTIGQWLHHNGIKDASNIASAARLCVGYRKGMWAKTTWQANEIIDSEIFDFVEGNAGYLGDCNRMASIAGKMAPRSLLASILFFGCGGRDPRGVEEAVWFVNALSTGESLTQDDAVLHFRNRMLSQTPQSRMDPFVRRALLTITWNKTISGEPCSIGGLRLRLTGPAKQKAPNIILIAGAA